MIQTYAIIIAATLNTISYSISLSHRLTRDETGVSALGTMSWSTHPGQGCPQRSQLQPRLPLPGRVAVGSGAAFISCSLAAPISSFNKRIVFIGGLLFRCNTTDGGITRLHVDCLLLCKNCVAA